MGPLQGDGSSSHREAAAGGPAPHPPVSTPLTCRVSPNEAPDRPTVESPGEGDGGPFHRQIRPLAPDLRAASESREPGPRVSSHVTLVYPEGLSSPAFPPHSGPRSHGAGGLPPDVVIKVKAASRSWGSLIFLLPQQTSVSSQSLPSSLPPLFRYPQPYPRPFPPPGVWLDRNLMADNSLSSQRKGWRKLLAHCLGARPACGGQARLPGASHAQSTPAEAPVDPPRREPPGLRTGTRLKGTRKARSVHKSVHWNGAL